MPRLLTYSSVAQMLDCSDDTVRRLVKRGLLSPPVTYNGLGKRFREEDVLLYLARASSGECQEKSSRRRTPQDAANEPPGDES